MSPPLPHAAIVGLAVSQFIGWGSTYYIPSILAPNFRADLGLSQEAVFGGTTIMLLVNAAAAPYAGRVIAKQGARAPMILGSILMGLALAILSQAHGLWSYAVAWMVVGLAAPIALTQGAMSALAQIAGDGARRSISRVLLITGFTASVFWPLTAWLEASIGWRSTCLVYAGLNLLVCLPVHALVVPSLRRPSQSALPVAPPVQKTVRLDPKAETLALVLTALAFSLAGFVSSGLGLQLVELLTAFGHPAATAVAIGALVGPAAVAARAGEATLGQRAGIMTVAMIAVVALPFALALPLLNGESVAVAAAFIVGYGMSTGTMLIVRSVLPLALFGKERYARVLGNLAVPQNGLTAFAPMIFAATMSGFGPRATLLLGLAGALLALGALVWLAALLRRSPAPG